VAFKASDEMVKQLLGYNLDIEEASGEKHHWLPVPSVFVIGKDGKIGFVYANPDYKARIDTDLLLAAARAAAKWPAEALRPWTVTSVRRVPAGGLWTAAPCRCSP